MDSSNSPLAEASPDLNSPTAMFDGGKGVTRIEFFIPRTQYLLNIIMSKDLNRTLIAPQYTVERRVILRSRAYTAKVMAAKMSTFSPQPRA